MKFNFKLWLLITGVSLVTAAFLHAYYPALAPVLKPLLWPLVGAVACLRIGRGME